MPGPEDPPTKASAPDPRLATEVPLLYTKLRVPSATPTLLPRPRLTSHLNHQPSGNLTLLSAPAGFGKTTLVVDWVRQQRDPVAWLTLDEQDNDPVLFWRYLVASLQMVDGRLGRRTQATLATPTTPSLEMAVTYLINDITRYFMPDMRLPLVLDDLHWIHTASIFQSLNYFLQHQPPQLHLLLLTRADPPLPLARLRVEGRLVELRAAELRLTQPEMASFFERALAMSIPEDVLHQLAEQTEGWAAGIQLVALSMRQRGVADAADQLQTLAGARQHVFAYLMEEVLRYQPNEVRQFLQQTAVLHRFCSSLCVAVTGQINAANLLRQLMSDNLFITPLDDEGQWYCYHPLLAELLRSNLDEATRRECHRRAARWYADQQLMQDAMRNALAAEDYGLMAALLTRTYKTFLANGLLISLRKWLATLPEEFQSPRLRLAAAWCRVYESNEHELQQIVSAINALSPEADEPLQGEVLAVQAVYASLYGQPEKGIEWATKALTLIAPDDYLSLAAAYQALGNAYRSKGELDASLAAYGQTRRQFEAMGNLYMGQLPLYRIASVQIIQGRLHQAQQTYEMVRQRAQEAGFEPLITTGEVFGHLSDLYLEWNELDQALAFARQEIELGQSGHMLLPLVDGYLKLAAVKAAQRDADAAREALLLAAEIAIQLESSPVSAQVEMHRARHELFWGNLPVAIAWAAEYSNQRASETSGLMPLLAQSADLLLARIWLVQGRTTAVLDLLQQVIHQCDAIGRIRLVAEANTLQALAWTKQRQEAAAQKALIRALTLAKQEGYIRVFVENGQELVPLLHKVRHLFPDYANRILRSLQEDAKNDPLTSPLLDPLTEREQEILSLIAQGQSNRQIADTLFISVGTVKGHINHILSKLDVQNRTQALVRARDLDLVD